MLFLLAMLATSPAATGVSEGAYGTAVGMIKRMYLEPDEVDEASLLHAAADALADKVHWLMIEPSGPAVYVRHADGTPIGSVSVASMDTLQEAMRKLETLIIDSGYDLGDIDVRLVLLKGMTGALDRYSRVMEGEGLDSFNTRLKGTTVGVGATMRLEDDQLRITSVVEGGPAEQGGMKVGDVVLRIDGRSTVNMPRSEAVRRIRGEEDTQVTLAVLRDGETHRFTLSRRLVVVPNVLHEVLDGDVGYIKITHISQQTVQNLVAALADLRQSGAIANGIVIDLRGNTGGSMKESARSADEFLTEGLLLRTVGPQGGPVKNLQSQMDAIASGSEPDVPVVVVVDERTASGSEILAGALLELDRAALVGARTYGKGTVQKIFSLDEATRLKLTVAQYLLANERVITDVGLVPDVVVRRVELDAYGVRFRNWDEDFLRTRWEDIVPSVVEHEGWRGQDVDRRDLPLEIARRAVLQATGSSRASVVDAIERVARQVRLEEEGHLVSALEHRQINWSPAEQDSIFMEARVDIDASPETVRSDVFTVTAEIHNLGDEPLARALVELECGTLSAWSGLVIPVGWVEPGARGVGQVNVALPPGIEGREDVVTVRLRADKRPALLVGDEVLTARSSGRPRLRVSARLVPHDEVTSRAEVTVHNMAGFPVSGVEVHFAYPGDQDVELIDRAARQSLIPAGEGRRFDLAMRIGPDASDSLPLRLIIESERYRELAEWPLDLPLDGSEVTLDAPRITARNVPLSAPAGPFGLSVKVLDDVRVDHVVVYDAGGTKVGWAGGEDDRLDLKVPLELESGVNRLLVVAEDNQGIVATRKFMVRGEPPAAVDAETE